MIKIVEATLFRAAIEVDNQGKIIRTPKGLSNFLNQPFSLLEKSLKEAKRDEKFQSFKIKDVEE
jgi:phosphorylcholine metabolism protein LicD